MGLYVSDPAPRDLAQEGRDTLAAQVELAPGQYAAAAKYRPLYDVLELGSINNALLGTGGQRGLLDLYQNEIAPAASALERSSQASQREADIAAVEQLGPRATAALRGVNPQQTALLDSLTRQAQGDVDAGYNLPAGLRSSVNQSIRSGQASRGLGFGPADAYQETLAQSDAANTWRQQNMARAGDVVRLNAATTGDPFMSVLGRPSNTAAAAGNLLGSGAGIGGSSQQVYGQFNPFNQYGGDLYNTNFNAKAASALNTDNAIAGMVSSGLSAL